MIRMLGVAVFLAVAVSASAQTEAPRFVEAGSVEMLGSWSDGTNISGVVVLGGHAVIGSDEAPHVQLGDWVVEGDRIRITKSGDLSVATPGSEPDVEALTVSGDALFAMGSHSAVRSRADRSDRKYGANRDRLLTQGIERHPERAVVFRIGLRDGRPVADGMTRASLQPALQANALLRDFVPLAGKENGVDIEGLAPGGLGLLAGFRGPVLRHGFVPILSFDFSTPQPGELLFVPLDGRGVRDLVRVSGGYLILAGPVGDGDEPHRVYFWNGLDCVPGAGRPAGRLSLLGDVPAKAGGKAEALVVVSESPRNYDVVIFYDSLPKGGPRRFRISRDAPLASASTRLCGG